MPKYRNPNAPDPMDEAKQRLTDEGYREGVHFYCPSKHHMRISEVNYWPASGKIYVDEATAAEKNKGLDALIAILRQRVPIRSSQIRLVALKS